MDIGLIDVDSHNYPNLALMKISAYHKAKGDHVEWAFPFKHYDVVYQSKVFDSTYSKDIDWYPDADKIVKGGTGYGIKDTLPDEIEHMCPDYSLYPEFTKNTAYGYLTRGCPNNCPFCGVSEKEGKKTVKVADLSEWWNGQKNIVLMDANLLACREHMGLLRQLSESRSLVDINQGFDARLLNEENIEAIKAIRIKEIHFAWDLMKNTDRIIEGLELWKKHGKKTRHGKFGSVYVLTNFNTTMDENLYRVYALRSMGFDPYIMIYDKPNAPEEIRRLQRWCNNKKIFASCNMFGEYDGR